MIKKTFWYLMLGLSFALFVLTLVQSNVFLLIASLALAFLVRVKGNKVLFGAYDRIRKEKIERLKKMRES
ncbi:hypothetical protein OYT88_04120 [Sporolactobacillus sp. CQH2019]|uniref:hypothetical protein n=1 Tax=Sporolactobacillus sp. CQH2019 TaxID=3023512 RepID=UPI0023674324|nr:hypothetical protein [Sporolactobacillus sp. CQH2019]MDD9147737.1 hypothetical protein [Sporolactobacillus sp. CQH2019]